MYKIILIVIIFSLSLSTSLADSPKSVKATYILQLSSNLGCDSTEIGIHSKQNGSQHALIFKSNAFAAVELQQGEYYYGKVICKINEKSLSFDIFKDKISPFKLNADQAYFAGKLIFLKSTTKESDIDVLNNCSNVASRARGDKYRDSSHGIQCRDGTGVSTVRKLIQQFKVFAPKASNEELSKVRNALKATKEQLIYLPLEV